MVKVDDAAGTPDAACGVAQSGRTPANGTFPTEDLAEDSAADLAEALAEEPVAAVLAEVAAALAEVAEVPELAEMLAEVAEVLAEVAEVLVEGAAA